MAESSLFWDGTTTGDATAAPYGAATVFSGYMSDALGLSATTNRGGVLLGITSQLAPSVVGAAVRVAAGAALVDGTEYVNTTNIDTNIPTPAASTRIDRIVLRKSWAAETVRLTRIAGAEGGAAPALTQSRGTTWDYPIAQASITTGGAITLTDQRSYSGGAQPIQSVASTAALALPSGSGILSLLVTGTTQVTSVTNLPPSGTIVVFTFNGVLQFTHGATLVMYGGNDLWTDSGATMTMVSTGSALVELSRSWGTTDSYYSAASADLTLTTSFQTPTSCSFTLTPGVWFVSGHATYLNNNNTNTIWIKLDAGGTVIDSANIAGNINNIYASGALSGGVITITTNTVVSLQAKDSVGNNGNLIKFNLTGLSKDTSIQAIRRA